MNRPSGDHDGCTFWPPSLVNGVSVAEPSSARTKISNDAAAIRDKGDRVVVRRQRRMQIETGVRGQLHRPLHAMSAARVASRQHVIATRPDQHDDHRGGERDDGHQRDARARAVRGARARVQQPAVGAAGTDGARPPRPGWIHR